MREFLTTLTMTATLMLLLPACALNSADAADSSRLMATSQDAPAKSPEPPAADAPGRISCPALTEMPLMLGRPCPCLATYNLAENGL